MMYNDPNANIKLSFQYTGTPPLTGFSYSAVFYLKYLSPVGSMIKFWVTTFWFLQNIKHHNHATFMNQKVVTQNFIVEPTGDKYFSSSNHKVLENGK